jgi:hypothetical protein
MKAEITQYLELLPTDRQEALTKLITLAESNLPNGFEAIIQYKMPSFVVPKSIYPAGYHCTPTEPLPFISFASQKNFIAIYHMGLYSLPELYEWFVNEYPKHSKSKLDMGKSCIRFKKTHEIPFDLLGELFTKMTPNQWIELYESKLKSGT